MFSQQHSEHDLYHRFRESCDNNGAATARYIVGRRLGNTNLRAEKNEISDFTKHLFKVTDENIYIDRFSCVRYTVKQCSKFRFIAYIICGISQ